MYSFRRQKAAGRQGEHALDRYWRSKGVGVEHAPPTLQRRGIDRILTAAGGDRMAVEYKTDRTAASSGRAFVELTVAERPGWAQTSEAGLLCYYVPGKKVAYLIRMRRLRERMEDWAKRCERRTVHNHRYQAVGLLVPLAELATISTSILHIQEE